MIRDKEILLGSETKTYHFSPIDELPGKVVSVEVAPIIGNKLGMARQSEVGKILEVPPSVISWWKFDDLTDIVGENDCNGGELENSALKSGSTAECGKKDLDLNNNMAISFWINGSANRDLVEKPGSYKISLENKKIRFDYLNSENFGVSDDEIIDGWNFIGVSISPATPVIQINSGIPKLLPKQTDGATLVLSESEIKFFGEIDEIMIFNRPIDSNTFNVLYTHQLR